MGWANIMTPEFIASTGVTGTLLIVSLIAIVKIYKDMRKDSDKRDKDSKERERRSEERENKLMKYLDKKSETDKHVAKTLEKIDKRLEALENQSNLNNKKSKK